MRYLVDPRLVVDVLENDPEWGERSALLLDAHRKDTLLLMPISYLALGPAFMGLRQMQDEFLASLHITVADHVPVDITYAAYNAWCGYQKDHPDAKGVGSVFDSLYMGAFGLLHDGVLTRQGDLFRKYYKTLRVIEP